MLGAQCFSFMPLSIRTVVSQCAEQRGRETVQPHVQGDRVRCGNHSLNKGRNGEGQPDVKEARLLYKNTPSPD